MATITLVVVLGLVGRAGADIVGLNLFDLGCPTEFNWDSPSWRADFDLGVTFTEITSVYLEWLGTITAEVVAPIGQPDKVHPIDAVFVATLYESDPHNYFSRVSVQAGQATYPEPELFGLRSVFTNEDWPALLDGKSNIGIRLAMITRPAYLYTVEYPSGNLILPLLYFEGTFVPEPATVLLFGLASLLLRTYNKN